MREWRKIERPAGDPRPRRAVHGGTCPKCSLPCTGGQAYCRACQNAKARATRRHHRELPDEQRFRANARAYLKEYVKRGKVAKLPCEVCGTADYVEGHHEDYTKPLHVRWLCRLHHNMVTHGKLALST